MQLDNMAHKNCTVSLVIFVAMLCIYCRVDFVKASIVKTDKDLTREVYSKLRFRKLRKSTKIQDTSSHRRRSIQEKVKEERQMYAQEIQEVSTLHAIIY
ncbi:hypothetical protein L2E82_38916 [Cichorium intybus]|uniref:Uncharacterized protein n=1 Tax=Cichorium intybus TaxID=13427 RepID=A0ACB9AG85_CICIN|nr:hypothetical protein L2E82_38916 [Cichorium intybus]